MADQEYNFRYIPLIPGDKRPLCKWSDINDIDSLDKLVEKYSDNINVGVRTGKDFNLIVIDFDYPKKDDDSKNPMDLLKSMKIDTYTIETRNGGKHFYFNFDGLPDNLQNAQGVGGYAIDIRANGGYVVGAGSFVEPSPAFDGKLHGDGNYYIVNDSKISSVPDFLKLMLSSYFNGEKNVVSRSLLLQKKPEKQEEDKVTKIFFDKYPTLKFRETLDSNRFAFDNPNGYNCPKCQRVHDHDGGFVSFVDNEEKFVIRLHCRRDGNGGFIIHEEMKKNEGKSVVANKFGKSQYDPKDSVNFGEMKEKLRKLGEKSYDSYKTAAGLIVAIAGKTIRLINNGKMTAVFRESEHDPYHEESLRQLKTNHGDFTLEYIKGFDEDGSPITANVRFWNIIESHAEYNFDYIEHRPRRPWQKLNDSRGFNTFIPPEAVKTDNINSNVIDAFRSYLLDVICSGDEKLREYIEKWITLLFCGLDEPLGVVLVLIGSPGAGKTKLFEILGKCLGDHLYIESPDLNDVVTRFNSTIANKRLNLIQDCSAADAFNKDFDRFKSVITDKTHTVEKKFKDREHIKNTLAFAICSNHSVPIKIEEGDRRYLPVRVSNVHLRDSIYYRKLSDLCMSKDGIDSIYSYYVSKCEGDFDYSEIKREVISEIPETETRTEIKLFCESSAISFLRAVKSNDIGFEFNNNRVSSTEFHSAYSAWAKRSDYHPLGARKFADEISGHIDRFTDPHKRVYYDISKINVK